MAAPKLCSINVDLDEIPNYFAIHGASLAVPDAASEAAHAVYDVAVPRLVETGRSLDVPITFFAVGEDLDRAANGAALKNALANGKNAVGNHSRSHLYDLTRRDRATIAREIDEGASSIEAATGVRPKGFRAPGYTITDEVFSLLPGLGVTYDSSVFPCPAYMAVKDAAIAAYRLLGRPSRSVVDTPAVLLAPTSPYRVGTPYWRRGNGVLELPVQVTRGARLPYYGTPLMMAGPDRARWLTKQVIGEPLVNLELHGIDLLDEHDAGLDDLGRVQRDLRVPLRQKSEVLEAIVSTLRAAGYAFVTLDEAAEAFAATA